MKDLAELEKRINVTFDNKSLLQQAIIHDSYITEHPDFKIGHNERLEFLGDAILEFIVSEHLYENYKDFSEEDLTNLRIALVNGEKLAEISKKINIEDFLMMGKGELRNTGKPPQTICANAIEALIGAIYLDKVHEKGYERGYDITKKFIKDIILSELDNILKTQSYRNSNYKSLFQEKAQKQHLKYSYELLHESGPDHNKRFKVALYLDGNKITEGEGVSKQEAEKDAARKALENQELFM
jgi:ribonuclease-3